MHVVDSSSPDALQQVEAVNGVLAEMGCADRPTLLVLTKADRMTDPSAADVLRARRPRAMLVSARTGEGLAELAQAVRAALGDTLPGPEAPLV